MRGWRLAVIERIRDGLLAPARVALGEDFVMPDLPQAEAFAWPLVQQRPAHLLPRKFASWDALLADAARELRGQLEGAGPLAERRWGERNTARICHPLAGALPDTLTVFGDAQRLNPQLLLRLQARQPRAQAARKRARSLS